MAFAPWLVFSVDAFPQMGFKVKPIRFNVTLRLSHTDRPDMPETFAIFLLSDATGETAETIVTAALTQFPDEPVQLIRHSNVRTETQVLGYIKEIKRRNAMVFYTFVDRELSAFMEQECKAQEIICLDLIGPLLHKMAYFFGHSPRGTPGLLHEVGEEYYQRMEAMEFALKYDDGQVLQHLDEADIVLVGVSRTSKTPLSIYLSGRGWKVANIPLVKDVGIAPELEAVDPKKVVGLFLDVRRLIERRAARLKSMGEERPTPYIDYDVVREELRWARALCRDHGWATVTVTGKSVEETAHEVLVKLKLK
ncbi:MAG: pyruvate, water dikinase regulatory protein [Gammaproteobacteria bacterium]